MNSGIYKIVNLGNGKIYIGSSRRLDRRWYMHKYNLRRGKHHCTPLQNSFNKHGEDSFEFIIMEECDCDLLQEREQYYLDTLSPDYNICPIAGSCKGRVLTDEHKKKIGETNKKLKLTEERKQEISRFMRKRVCTTETRAKMAAARIGKKHTEESKQKMRGPKKK